MQKEQRRQIGRAGGDVGDCGVWGHGDIVVGAWVG